MICQRYGTLVTTAARTSISLMQNITSPGYGLYDRALGLMYMLGVWDLLDKLAGKKTTV